MDKTIREKRLRRVADRAGYRLKKSRARDARDITFGGYQLISIEHGGCDLGYGNADRGYAADLDDIEEWAHNFLKRGDGVLHAKYHCLCRISPLEQVML